MAEFPQHFAGIANADLRVRQASAAQRLRSSLDRGNYTKMLIVLAVSLPDRFGSALFLPPHSFSQF